MCSAHRPCCVMDIIRCVEVVAVCQYAGVVYQSARRFSEVAYMGACASRTEGLRSNFLGLVFTHGHVVFGQLLIPLRKNQQGVLSKCFHVCSLGRGRRNWPLSSTVGPLLFEGTGPIIREHKLLYHTNMSTLIQVAAAVPPTVTALPKSQVPPPPPPMYCCREHARLIRSAVVCSITRPSTQ